MTPREWLTWLGSEHIDVPPGEKSETYGTCINDSSGPITIVAFWPHMHEIGINPIGVNPHHGACRNPYDRSRITGGSSDARLVTCSPQILPGPSWVPPSAVCC